MARGVSTVLDVAVCLLLIGTALATLAATPPAERPDAPDADGPAETVSTVTTGIPVGDGTRHATIAEHLATAAVSAATFDNRRLVETSYPATVGNATAAAVGHRRNVTATWSPYGNAPVRGRITAGDVPPADADVAATMITVDSGITPPGPDAAASFDALGAALAEAVVTWLLPPGRTRAALLDPRTAPATADRYHHVADGVGVDVGRPVDEADVHVANDRLAAELGAMFAADLESRYEDPGTARAAVTVDEVTIVVRRWQR